MAEIANIYVGFTRHVVITARGDLCRLPDVAIQDSDGLVYKGAYLDSGSFAKAPEAKPLFAPADYPLALYDPVLGMSTARQISLPEETPLQPVVS